MTSNRTGARSSALVLAFAVLVVLSLGAAVSVVENQMTAIYDFSDKANPIRIVR